MLFTCKIKRSLFALACITCPLLLSGAKGQSSLNGKTGVEERIIGGTHPPEGKYPSLARIEKDVYKNGSFYTWSSATIINRDWLLGAADHFVSYGTHNLSRFRVVVGDSVINETEPYEQIVYIERLIIHERYVYKGSVPSENIAVLKVAPQIKYSNRVSPVNLPSCKQEATGTAWVPGWGPIRRIGNGSSVLDYRLREIDCEINTIEKCHQRLKQLGRPEIKLTDLYLCTNETGKKGVCVGEKGTPLFLIKNESYMVQVGIFVARPAYQFRCGYEDQVGVYINVSKYVGWIHRRISGCGNHRFPPTLRPSISSEVAGDGEDMSFPA